MQIIDGNIVYMTIIPFKEKREELMWNGEVMSSLSDFHIENIIRLLTKSEQPNRVLYNYTIGDWKLFMEEELKYREAEAEASWKRYRDSLREIF